MEGFFNLFIIKVFSPTTVSINNGLQESDVEQALTRSHHIL